jgi:hypothetical protein
MEQTLHKENMKLQRTKGPTITMNEIALQGQDNKQV